MSTQFGLPLRRKEEEKRFEKCVVIAERDMRMQFHLPFISLLTRGEGADPKHSA